MPTPKGKPVPPFVVATVRHCVRWLRRHYPLPDPYRVRVVTLPNHDHLTDANGGAGWAAFVFNRKRYGEHRAHIYLPLGWIIPRAGRGLDAQGELIHTICHEWAHAHQWASGQKPTERNVNRRAARWAREYAMNARRN